MSVQSTARVRHRADVSRNRVVVKERPVVFRNLAPDIPGTTYGTFGLYRYPAKFIPQVIAYALKTYSHSGMSVFDPFAGYGTVGTVARLYGNHYELWDLNPLLKHLHAIAAMKPVELDSNTLIRKMSAHKKPFAPDWKNIAYWYPERFLPMLSRAWGFYHHIEDEKTKRMLLIPLIKATRYFSYNDEKRQKLSRSRIAQERTDKLITQDWEHVFQGMVGKGVDNISRKLREYQGLKPQSVRTRVRAGVNALGSSLDKEHDILITSPPYLQAQEYIRASKMDLFWLGYSEDKIRELGKKEFPYQDVPPCPIHSPTYFACLERINEPHMIELFRRYFFGVLGALSNVQDKIAKHLLLFLGPATIRSEPIPIARIFAEHFGVLGWRHEATLIDTIVARTMFFYGANPATGSVDRRMSTEHLVVLSRK